jgi:hypothetical protein
LPDNIHQTIARQIRKQFIMQMFKETISEIQHLIVISVAMSSLVLLKAIQEKPLKLIDLKAKSQRLSTLPDFLQT